MANARIAAIACTILSATLVAQPSAHSHFAINVKNSDGIAISGVKIEAIDPSWGKESLKREVVAKTDAEGNASHELPPGHRVYELHADATDATGNSTLTLKIGRFECSDGPGWSQKCSLQIDTNAAFIQPIKLTATVLPLGCTLCVDDNAATISVESAVSADPIPLLPLRTLDPLHARGHRSRQ